MRSPTRAVRRYSTAVMATILLAAAVIMSTTQDGFTSRAVELGLGSVWVSSQGPGQLALLDGASAAVTVRLKVADDGHDVTAVQGERAGYAVDRTSGTVTRVDAATWTATAAVPIDGATAGLTATTAGAGLYLTDVRRGLVVRADPDSLLPSGQPQSLSATRGAGAPVADGTGALWLLDATNGDLIRMTDTPARTESGFSAGTSSQLLLVQGGPVVVDLVDRTATRIDPATGRRDGSPACVDADPTDSTVTMAGSPTDPVVYLVSGRDGLLRISDLAAGTCSQAISVTTSANELGQPVAMSGRVFIPNRTTGQIIVVDLRTRHPNVTAPVAQPNSKLELLGQDGFVYYNDPASSTAGVVREDGSIRPIPKYDAVNPDLGVYRQPQLPAETTTPAPPAGSAPQHTDAPVIDPPAPATLGTQVPADPSSPPPPTAPPPTAPTTELPVPPGPVLTTLPPELPSPPPTPTPLPPPPPVQPSAPSAPTSASPTSSSSPSSTVPDSSAPSTERPMRSVTITIAGNGSIGDQGLGIACSDSCTVDIPDGTSVTLVATPGTDHEWTGWSGACSGATPTCSFRPGSTMSIGGTFTRQSVPLTTTVTGRGTITATTVVTCTTAQTPCSGTQPKGTPLTLQATPDTGWTLATWTGDCSGIGQCTLPIAGPQTVGATFVRIPPGEPGTTQSWLYEIPPTNTLIGSDGNPTSFVRLSGRQTAYRSGDTDFLNSTEQWIGCDGNTDQSVYPLPPGKYTTLSTTAALRDGVPTGLVAVLTFTAAGHPPHQVAITKDSPVQIDYDVTGSASLTITAKTGSACGTADVGYGVFVDAVLG